MITKTKTLTPCETQILDAIFEGESGAEVAIRFGIAKSTVDFHLQNAYRKLGVKNRMQALVTRQILEELNTEITNEQIKVIEKYAMEATPGPYRVSVWSDCGYEISDARFGLAGIKYMYAKLADAAYASVADPGTILAMIARLRSAETKNALK